MFHTVDEFHDKPVRTNNNNFKYDRMTTEAGQKVSPALGLRFGIHQRKVSR